MLGGKEKKKKKKNQKGLFAFRKLSLS